MSGGRPTKYEPEFCEQVKHLCKLGATDFEIAQFFGISKPTLYEWKSRYPEFSNSIKIAKQDADERVERSLYEKANGYSFDSEKVFCSDGEVVRADTVTHVPPDTTACIFWLKNRNPKKWRDKQELQHDGSLNINIIGMPIDDEGSG